ncbi:hypothetical protein AG1IA_02533 [Rhizoctonia solani AG-1 IA]|uniref:Uncharacterized protein n=1 Tax=Thanatephorus cucumeris (strain AG1-IA) TaxID=983506 RepID=L8WZC1_THACA|nr:hypothetical protein AG1IA_02533 [Rhizoctonia solani AG-1 IA]
MILMKMLSTSAELSGETDPTLSCFASSITDSGGAVVLVGAAMALRGRARAKADRRNRMAKRAGAVLGSLLYIAAFGLFETAYFNVVDSESNGREGTMSSRRVHTNHKVSKVTKHQHEKAAVLHILMLCISASNKSTPKSSRSIASLGTPKPEF